MHLHYNNCAMPSCSKTRLFCLSILEVNPGLCVINHPTVTNLLIGLRYKECLKNP